MQPLRLQPVPDELPVSESPTRYEARGVSAAPLLFCGVSPNPILRDGNRRSLSRAGDAFREPYHSHTMRVRPKSSSRRIANARRALELREGATWEFKIDIRWSCKSLRLSELKMAGRVKRSANLYNDNVSTDWTLLLL